MKHKFLRVPKYVIEPKEPIGSSDDIIEEVRKFYEDKGENISILDIKKDKVVVFSIDSKKYVARTDRFVGLFGGGRAIDEPYPFFYFSGPIGNIGGFKMIYIFSYED